MELRRTFASSWGHYLAFWGVKSYLPFLCPFFKTLQIHLLDVVVIVIVDLPVEESIISKISDCGIWRPPGDHWCGKGREVSLTLFLWGTPESTLVLRERHPSTMTCILLCLFVCLFVRLFVLLLFWYFFYLRTYVNFFLSFFIYFITTSKTLLDWFCVYLVTCFLTPIWNATSVHASEKVWRQIILYAVDTFRVFFLCMRKMSIKAFRAYNIWFS